MTEETPSPAELRARDKWKMDRNVPHVQPQPWRASLRWVLANPQAFRRLIANQPIPVLTELVFRARDKRAKWETEKLTPPFQLQPQLTALERVLLNPAACGWQPASHSSFSPNTTLFEFTWREERDDSACTCEHARACTCPEPITWKLSFREPALLNGQPAQQVDLTWSAPDTNDFQNLRFYINWSSDSLTIAGLRIDFIDSTPDFFNSNGDSSGKLIGCIGYSSTNQQATQVEIINRMALVIAARELIQDYPWADPEYILAACLTSWLPSVILDLRLE